MKLRQTLRGNKGLTLLEVLVSVFVLAIVAAPLLNMFVTNTVMLRKSYEKTTDTYDGKTMLENMYGLSYSVLIGKNTGEGTASITSDDSSGKLLSSAPGTGMLYTLTVRPSGPKLADTDAIYHLIIGDTGAGLFVGPDGTSAAVAAADLPNYTPSFPTGDHPLLIVNTLYKSTTVIHCNDSVTCYLYTPPDVKNGVIKVLDAKALQIYKNDVPPSKMLLDCVLKTYRAKDSSTQDGVFQTTMEVSLP